MVFDSHDFASKAQELYVDERKQLIDAAYRLQVITDKLRTYAAGLW
jgi:hypothetical protein